MAQPPASPAHTWPRRRPPRECLQKAPGIIGRAAETEAGRGARLYHMLQDFGEADLVLG